MTVVTGHGGALTLQRAPVAVDADLALLLGLDAVDRRVFEALWVDPLGVDWAVVTRGIDVGRLLASENDQQ
jgi:hypothetical protein